MSILSVGSLWMEGHKENDLCRVPTVLLKLLCSDLKHPTVLD